MDLILHRILETQDLGAWSKIKKAFFASPYDRIYELIAKFYETYDKLPTFSELELVIRNERDVTAIKALELVRVPDDIETEVLVQALINEYGQKLVLNSLDSYLDELPFKDNVDIIEDLAHIALDIEEKTESSEQVSTMRDYKTIDIAEFMSRIPLGISNDFDQHSLGLAPSEMIMFGGHRGSGKSLICSNIVCNQYLQGNSSLYFTIEMRGKEIFQRNLSILSGVRKRSIKTGKLSDRDKQTIATLRARMTQNGSPDLLEIYAKDEDFDKFEAAVLDRPLSNNQLVIVDNPQLTLANIDATISTFKTKFDERLKVVVVDYINQIYEKDSYKWDVQIGISKKLKALARKYDIVMITPYQTKEDGEARFAKGILDSPDWAYSTKPYKTSEGDEIDAIEFTCQKGRDERRFDFTSAIDWDILKLFASESPMINSKSPIKGAKKGTEPIVMPANNGEDLE
jgi:replicative DNA helicase